MRHIRIVLLGVSLALASALPIFANNDVGRSATMSPAPVGHVLYVEPGHPAPLTAHDDAVLFVGDQVTSTTLSKFQPIPTPEAARTNSVYDRIKGRASFVRRVKAALDWLQVNDVEAYQRVDVYVTTIAQSPYAHLATAQPLSAGGCLVRALATRSMSVPMIAALLFHEASHCYQFATVGVLTSKEAEVYAYTEQIAFMERNGFPAEELEYYHRVLAYYASQPDDGQYIPPPDF